MRRLIVAAMCAALLTEAAQAETELDIQNPVWLRQPDGRDFALNYPSQAASQAVEGRATIECYVRLDTTLDCHVTAESPASWGFGDAALAIARSFRLEPAQIDGVPVEGGRIRRTLRFVLPNSNPQDWTPDQRAFVEMSPPPDLPNWEEAPTSSVVLMATPAPARAANTQGRGVLSCRVGDARRLLCEPLFEMPAGSGFAAAAMTLAPSFRVAEGNRDFIAKYAHEPFLLPISFGSAPDITPVNRAHAGVGPLNLPPLVVGPDMLPARARAARISGAASALCTVQSAPSLACVIERETPIEWGIGAQVIDMIQHFPAPPPQAGLIAGDELRITVEFRPD